MENFAALQKSPEAPLEASEVATEYTIAIQESPGPPLQASEVATDIMATEKVLIIRGCWMTQEYDTNKRGQCNGYRGSTGYKRLLDDTRGVIVAFWPSGIESPGAASRLPGEQEKHVIQNQPLQPLESPEASGTGQ
ncbi:hypothetical protein K440DRAFT_642727 [Wilcoxina mikolae CBS 423.85]|nr:hypothetical protein K440DRAFT_642727 [Wilcoxina mikolae CBS 423.85]